MNLRFLSVFTGVLLLAGGQALAGTGYHLYCAEPKVIATVAGPVFHKLEELPSLARHQGFFGRWKRTPEPREVLEYLGWGDGRLHRLLRQSLSPKKEPHSPLVDLLRTVSGDAGMRMFSQGVFISESFPKPQGGSNRCVVVAVGGVPWRIQRDLAAGLAERAVLAEANQEALHHSSPEQDTPPVSAPGLVWRQFLKTGAITH